MKAWRIISLTLWSVILLGLLAVSAIYFVLDQSVMNQAKMERAFESHGVYKLIRSEQIIPQFMARAPSAIGDTGILTRSDLLKALEQVFSDEKVKALSGQVSGVVYEWLNKKRPDLTFTIDLSQEKQQLLSLLTDTVGAHAAQLPVCTHTFPDMTDLREIICLPYYTDTETVVATVNSDLASHFETLDSTLTNEDAALTTRQLGGLINLPDYYGYFWAANLVTLPLAGLLALYLLIKRRGAGLIAIGAAVLACGGALLVGYVMANGLGSDDSPLTQSFLLAVREVLQGSMGLFGGIGVGVGAVFIFLGIVWTIRKGKRTKRAAKPENTKQESTDIQ